MVKDLALCFIGWLWLFKICNWKERMVMILKLIVFVMADWNDVLEDIIKSVIDIGVIIYKKRKSKLKRR